MNGKQIIIAVDGYSSCGKSTIAKQLAEHAGYTYIDTGAMYRAVALYLHTNGITISKDNEAEIETILPRIHVTFTKTASGQHVCLNGEDVETQIRTLEIGNLASQVSTLGSVRRFLVEQQQAMGKQKGIVMDGRDIGTVVFPNAELKLFLTASPEIRAERRFVELQQKGENPLFEDVLRDLGDRDYRDTHRAESPLRQAEDAVVIDNSNLTRQQQLAKVIQLWEEKVKGTSKI